MTPESNSSLPKTCPTCGTRLSENATRCLVCGRSFATTTKKTSDSPVQSPKLPELKVGLPAAIGLIVLVLGLGAALIFVILQSTGRVTTPSETPTVTITPTLTFTPSPTTQPTIGPTATPEPPQEYVVKAGDFCSSIALAYGISIQSIAELNQLPPDCGTLYTNQKLLIPRPTPTLTAMPTATLSAAEATEQACGTVSYEVKENDTLSSISANYNISIESIKNFNRLTSDNVFVGFMLNLPLCERRPTQGPTPTATLPPPYAAASLLLPADGTVFTNVNESIALQWSSVGSLRETEAYAITVEDVTSGGGKKVVEYTRETKFVVPSSLRPLDNTFHIFRWSVVAARQTGTTADGQPEYSVYGTVSPFRVFGWAGTSGSTTQTP
jgi:LysM repeat protein